MRTTPRRLYLATVFTECAGILVIFSVSRDLAQHGADLLKMGWVGGGEALVRASPV